jgi:hypothetical protein
MMLRLTRKLTRNPVAMGTAGLALVPSQDESSDSPGIPLPNLSCTEARIGPNCRYQVHESLRFLKEGLWVSRYSQSQKFTLQMSMKIQEPILLYLEGAHGFQSDNSEHVFLCPHRFTAHLLGSSPPGSRLGPWFSSLRLMTFGSLPELVQAMGCRLP